jgi:8-oxo-dGTP diphosphatase
MPGRVPSAVTVMPDEPALLARGPWDPDDVEVRWSDDPYDPPPARVEQADAAIAALRERGSPSHDGLAARLVSHEEHDGRLTMHLQPVRWALRLVEGDASLSVAALCVTRAADGRWLAGRRARWLSSWPGRWALGAGGAVDVGESPVDTLTRELDEEWSVAPERVRCEALVRLPHKLVMFVGQAWLPEGATVTPDHEHDDYAWWPAAIEDWPPEADEPLRLMAGLLA